MLYPVINVHLHKKKTYRSLHLKIPFLINEYVILIKLISILPTNKEIQGQDESHSFYSSWWIFKQVFSLNSSL